MDVYVEFLVLGLGIGAVYAVFANGLIAVYRATGVINFAQGAVAMWGAYAAADLHRTGRLVLPIGHITFAEPGTVDVHLAAAIGVVYGTLMAVGCYLLVFRPMSAANPLAQVVASIGLLISLQALATIRFGTLTINTEALLPSGRMQILGLDLQKDSMILAAIAITLCLGLIQIFRRTRLGIAMRAGAESAVHLQLVGFSPTRLAGYAWIAAGAAASAIVVLAAPSVGLDLTIYTLAVVPALAVALLARIDSYGMATAAGLAVGGLQAVITYLTSNSWWPEWAKNGVQELVPLTIVLVALVLTGSRIPARGAAGASLPRVTTPNRNPLIYVVPVALLVAASATMTPSYRYAVTISMILAMLYLSYVVLTGYLGQISLAQLAFGGVAAYALAKISMNTGLPFLPALLIAVLASVAIGVLIGIPALRIRGVQLAVVTISFAVAMQKLVFQNPALIPMTGNKINGATVFGIDISVREPGDVARIEFTAFVAILLILLLTLLGSVLRGRVGRRMLAVRANERVAASVGIGVSATKLAGFAAAAAIAGLAGALLGYSQGLVTADSYGIMVGLTALALIYLGGIGSFTGAMIAGAIGPLGILYVFLTQTVDLGTWYPLTAGVLLVLTSLLNPIGVAGALRDARNLVVSRLRRPTRSTPAPAPTATPTATATPTPTATAASLKEA